MRVSGEKPAHIARRLGVARSSVHRMLEGAVGASGGVAAVAAVAAAGRRLAWLNADAARIPLAERFGVGDRLTTVAGDLLEVDFGSGHKVATLGHILHSEGVERCRALLRRSHEALAPGGTIAIAEFLVDADRRGPMSGLIFAVNMLVNTEAGGTYSFDEIADWLTEVGSPVHVTCPHPARRR